MVVSLQASQTLPPESSAAEGLRVSFPMSMGTWAAGAQIIPRTVEGPALPKKMPSVRPIRSKALIDMWLRLFMGLVHILSSDVG